MGIISILISVLSFLMSAFSLASTYYEKHIKTKCYLRWVSQDELFTEPNRTQLTISLLVSNMSSRPSTITNILLKNQNEYVESTWYPIIYRYRGQKTSYSDCTPLNVPSRSAKEFIIVFQHLQGFKIEDKITFSFIIDEREIKKTLPVKLILDGDHAFKAMETRLT